MFVISTGTSKGTATAWLVSTVGSGNRHGKGLKKEILQTSIPEICTDVISSKRSLRITSNLMYGLTLIYKYKMDLMLSDILLMNSRLSKDMVLLRIQKKSYVAVEKGSSTVDRGKTTNWILNDDPKFDIDYDLCPPFSDDIESRPNSDLIFSSMIETSDDVCSSFDKTLQLSQILGDQSELDFQFAEDGTEEISEIRKILKSVTINEEPLQVPEFEMKLPDDPNFKDITQVTNELSNRLEPSSFYYREREREIVSPRTILKKRKILLDVSTTIPHGQVALSSNCRSANNYLNINLVSPNLPWLMKQAYKYLTGTQSAAALDHILKPHEFQEDTDMEMEVSRRHDNSHWHLQLDPGFDLELNLDLNLNEEVPHFNEDFSLSPVSEENNLAEVPNSSDTHGALNFMNNLQARFENILEGGHLGAEIPFSTLFPPTITTRIEAASFFSSTLALTSTSQIEISLGESTGCQTATDFRLRMLS